LGLNFMKKKAFGFLSVGKRKDKLKEKLIKY